MSEMIERVARAFTGLHIVTGEGSIVPAEAVARAAIEAMREPTEAMHDAGSQDLEFRHQIYGVWEAMIDAALEVPAPSGSDGPPDYER